MELDLSWLRVMLDRKKAGKLFQLEKKLSCQIQSLQEEFSKVHKEREFLEKHTLEEERALWQECGKVKILRSCHDKRKKQNGATSGIRRPSKNEKNIAEAIEMALSGNLESALALMKGGK